MALTRRRTPRTVLVLRALGLGDLLTAVPALRGLRRAYPRERIVLAAPAALAGLLPAVAAVDALAPVPALAEFAWNASPPAFAVNLHGCGPQSIGALRSARPGHLLSHTHHDHPDVVGPQWMRAQHEVDRWCRMLAFYGIGCEPTDLSLGPPRVASPAPGAVVVHPGASYPARRWPAERFARVAAALAENRYDVVLTGTEGERGPAEDVARRAGLPRDSVLAGRTDVEELAALVADAALVVCGDTGVGHLATAYGTPSVVLFGPVPPHRWGPPAGRPQHVALWAGTSGDTFGASPDPGLLRLSTTRVIEQAQRLLDQRETSRRRAPKRAKQKRRETLSSKRG